MEEIMLQNTTMGRDKRKKKTEKFSRVTEMSVRIIHTTDAVISAKL